MAKTGSGVEDPAWLASAMQKTPVPAVMESPAGSTAVEVSWQCGVPREEPKGLAFQGDEDLDPVPSPDHMFNWGTSCT